MESTIVSPKLHYLHKKADITENLIKKLHSWIMCGLLIDEEEGLPGEYQKYSVGVSGSSASPTTMIEEPDENIFEYICRIHTELQNIHPFRDGYGPIGRLIMNLHLMRYEYPVLVLPTSR